MSPAGTGTPHLPELPGAGWETPPGAGGSSSLPRPHLDGLDPDVQRWQVSPSSSSSRSSSTRSSFPEMLLELRKQSRKSPASVGSTLGRGRPRGTGGPGSSPVAAVGASGLADQPPPRGTLQAEVDVQPGPADHLPGTGDGGTGSGEPRPVPHGTAPYRYLDPAVPSSPGPTCPQHPGTSPVPAPLCSGVTPGSGFPSPSPGTPVSLRCRYQLPCYRPTAGPNPAGTGPVWAPNPPVPALYGPKPAGTGPVRAPTPPVPGARPPGRRWRARPGRSTPVARRAART